MKLAALLEDLEYELLDRNGAVIEDDALRQQALDTEVTSITNDSRKAEPGSLFFAIVGANSDGHDYAAQVIGKGASVLVVEHAVRLEGNSDAAETSAEALDAAGSSRNPQWKPDEDLLENAVEKTGTLSGPVFVKVQNSRYAMALISAAYYGHPARRMKMIGVTGTKGKTTTTYLVKSILEHAGIDMGLIGTIESTYHDVHRPAHNTTPESLELQKDLKEMADAGVQAVVMEVSSQALKLDRTAGILYDIGVFTNLSEDHIGPNEHPTFEDYLHCKSLLFRQCRVGIVNGDDPYVDRILENSTCEVERYGIQPTNDLYADHLQLVTKPGELGIAFDAEGLVKVSCEVPTPGRFSVYNALAAIAICRHFNVTNDEIKDALLHAKAKGRIELVKVSDKFTLMIDYAHNAVALENLLTSLREYHPHRLITLFGCGGNRSKVRRFEMGEVSGRLSDFTIITSDNPRFEDPLAIIADIVTGISKTDGKYITIPDRREAIAYAIHHGEPGDIIVLAGKGHEDYQEIKGVRYPMDERVIIREILEKDHQRSE